MSDTLRHYLCPQVRDLVSVGSHVGRCRLGRGSVATLHEDLCRPYGCHLVSLAKARSSDWICRIAGSESEKMV